MIETRSQRARQSYCPNRTAVVARRRNFSPPRLRHRRDSPHRFHATRVADDRQRVRPHATSTVAKLTAASSRSVRQRAPRTYAPEFSKFAWGLLLCVQRRASSGSIRYI
ncbi:hypothetical protein Trydic_g13544 [Trypoxylus dichotomus]